MTVVLMSRRDAHAREPPRQQLALEAARQSMVATDDRWSRLSSVKYFRLRKRPRFEDTTRHFLAVENFWMQLWPRLDCFRRSRGEEHVHEMKTLSQPIHLQNILNAQESAVCSGRSRGRSSLRNSRSRMGSATLGLGVESLVGFRVNPVRVLEALHRKVVIVEQKRKAGALLNNNNNN